jgi:predicted phosphodiesterase
MKIAIISDIHGNVHALDAVLADIAQVGVDQIIVNGDLVNRGPSNVAVMERLAGDEFIITLGNHDALMVNWYDQDKNIPAEWFTDPFWNATKWSVAQLHNAGYLERLRTFPLTHEIAIPDSPKVLISHGSPRHYREGYGPFLAADAYFEIIEAFPADIYIGSHTHRPDEREIAGKTFLNSGSVGAPFNGNTRAQYLLLTLEQNEWKWEFCGVRYDRHAAIAEYKLSGLIPDGNLSAHIFMMELQYAVPIYPVFWSWAEQQEKVMDWTAWAEFMTLYGTHLVEPTE